MSENSAVVKALLQKMTDELKQQKSLSYAGHKNLWLDLGWDITQGDGEICRYVEDMLRFIIDNLPEQMQELVWAESWAGKAKLAESNNLTTLDPEELFQGIFDYLKDSLFHAAEADYDQYQASEVSEYSEGDEYKSYDNPSDYD